MSFSDNLKTIRKEKNLSQEELAELLGVSRQAVSKWELGDGYPEAEKLLIIAGKLNVSLDALMDTEIVNTAVNKHNAPGQITITSPYEGVIVRCNKVVKSQKFKGGKAFPCPSAQRRGIRSARSSGTDTLRKHEERKTKP